MTIFTLGDATALALGRVGVRPSRPSGVPRRTGVHPIAPNRTGAPVRRGSIEAGTFEGAFFKVPGKGETDRLVRTARAALDAGRRLKRAARIEGRALSADERSLVAISAGAVRVYEEICALARLNQGRVFPSYDHLARATALGRATVARALATLETAGFLLRQRRFRKIAGDGPGPRHAQTSNVYRPTLPGRLLALLPRWLRPAPLPADVVQRAAEHGAELAAMQTSLSCRELAEATVGGGMLGRALASLGGWIDEAESESHHEPGQLLQSLNKKPIAPTTRRPCSRWPW